MKSVDVKSSTFIDFDKENNKKDTRFKVSDHEEYQNIKMFFEKIRIGVKKCLRLKK